MKQRIAHRMTPCLDQRRVLGALASSAFVVGGTFNAVNVTLVWLLQPRSHRAPRS